MLRMFEDVLVVLLKNTLLFLLLQSKCEYFKHRQYTCLLFISFHTKLLVGISLECLFYYHSLNNNFVLYELIVCMEVIASMEMQTADPNLDINYR